MVDRRTKWTESWDPGTVVTHMHLVHLVKMTCKSETVCRTAKGGEIWDSGILVTHIRGTF